MKLSKAWIVLIVVGLMLNIGNMLVSADSKHGTDVLRPNAAGYSSFWTKSGAGGSNYDRVDEATSDGNTTYVYASSTLMIDGYNIDDWNGLSDCKTIDSIVVSCVALKVGGSSATKIKFGFRIGTTNYFSSAQTLTLGYLEYKYDISAVYDFSDSLVDSMQLIVQGDTIPRGYSIRVTQMFLTIQYTLSGPSFDDQEPTEGSTVYLGCSTLVNTSAVFTYCGGSGFDIHNEVCKFQTNQSGSWVTYGWCNKTATVRGRAYPYAWLNVSKEGKIWWRVNFSETWCNTYENVTTYFYSMWIPCITNPVPVNGSTVNASDGLNTSVNVSYRKFSYPYEIIGNYNVTVDLLDTVTWGREGLNYISVWNNSIGQYQSNPIIIGQANDIGTYVVFRSFLYFNTTSIPSNAIIDNVSLEMVVESSGISRDFSIVVQSGMPNYPEYPSTSTDYNRTYYSGNGGSINTSDISLVFPDSFKIYFNSTGLGWIQKGNITKIALRSDREIAGQLPQYEVIELIGIGDGYPELEPILNIKYHGETNWSRVVNVSWSSNSSGSWLQYGFVQALCNGTYTVFNSNFTSGHKYYWYVNDTVNNTVDLDGWETWWFEMVAKKLSIGIIVTILKSSSDYMKYLFVVFGMSPFLFIFGRRKKRKKRMK